MQAYATRTQTVTLYEQNYSYSSAWGLTSYLYIDTPTFSNAERIGEATKEKKKKNQRLTTLPLQKAKEETKETKVHYAFSASWVVAGSNELQELIRVTWPRMTEGNCVSWPGRRDCWSSSVWHCDPEWQAVLRFRMTVSCQSSQHWSPNVPNTNLTQSQDCSTRVRIFKDAGPKNVQKAKSKISRFQQEKQKKLMKHSSLEKLKN